MKCDDEAPDENDDKFLEFLNPDFGEVQTFKQDDPEPQPTYSSGPERVKSTRGRKPSNKASNNGAGPSTSQAGLTRRSRLTSNHGELEGSSSTSVDSLLSERRPPPPIDPPTNPEMLLPLAIHWAASRSVSRGEQSAAFKSALSAALGDSQASRGPNRKCTCQKSRCLKMYCECFAAGVSCEGCACKGCCNNQENAEKVQQAQAKIETRAPLTFVSKGLESKVASMFQKICKCKRSHCLKKYCECYQSDRIGEGPNARGISLKHGRPRIGPGIHREGGLCICTHQIQEHLKAGIKCSQLCKCTGCKNLQEEPDSSAPSSAPSTTLPNTQVPQIPQAHTFILSRPQPSLPPSGGPPVPPAARKPNGIRDAPSSSQDTTDTSYSCGDSATSRMSTQSGMEILSKEVSGLNYGRTTRRMYAAEEKLVTRLWEQEDSEMEPERDEDPEGWETCRQLTKLAISCDPVASPKLGHRPVGVLTEWPRNSPRWHSVLSPAFGSKVAMTPSPDKCSVKCVASPTPSEVALQANESPFSSIQTRGLSMRDEEGKNDSSNSTDVATISGRANLMGSSHHHLPREHAASGLVFNPLVQHPAEAHAKSIEAFVGCMDLANADMALPGHGNCWDLSAFSSPPGKLVVMPRDFDSDLEDSPPSSPEWNPIWGAHLTQGLPQQGVWEC